jgi:hypothetical protein
MDTACGAELLFGLRKLTLASSVLTGARGVMAAGMLAAAIAGDAGCVPGRNALGVKGPRGNATIASKVTHRTVKRVVGFNLGSSFRKSPITTARNVPSQIPLRRVVIAKLTYVISALLVHSP